jgi:hypothetical protein
MAVTITGGKYAIRSLSAAGTTTVTIGTGTFAAGDFGVTQRMVALFTSGNVFKGIAWVRRFTSTTALELENRFVDPVTGVYATQAVGDQVLVSKNAAESATAGFTVTTPDNNVVTVSDNVLMGTAGSETSVCFYDQHKQFTMTNGFRFNGGVAVFGKLMSYDGVSKESFVWSRECTARPNENYPLAGDPQYNLWGTGGTSAHMFFFGGAIGSPMRRSFFIGAEGTGATNKTYALFGTRIYHACASPGNGGNWASNAARHLLFKTIHEADYNNANLVVWGNGAFQGSYLAFPQFGAGSPLGIFRASNAASFGASANNRTVVADLGSGSFIDDINNGSYTFTNVITPAVTVARFAGGNVPITFQFSDDYTNLQPRTTLVVRRGDGTLATSVVNTASSTFTATVVQATYSATGNGAASPTNFYTTFNFGIFCYGYQAISGTHTPYTFPLGTAGNGTDLKLGGLINQVADTGVTLTETEALALSSKITVNSGTSTITITGNATYDELYDYTIAWKCASAANAVVPNHTRYLLVSNGTSLSAPTGWTLVVNTGVTLSAGTKFDFVSFTTVTLAGTGRITAIYGTSSGVSTLLELRGVKAGASYLAMNNATKATILFGVNNTGTTQDYPIYFPPGSTGLQVYVARKLHTDQIDFEVITLAPGGMWYQFIDIPDEGISETNLATVQAYTSLATTNKLYDYISAFQTTETGLKLGNIVTRAGPLLQFGNYSGLVKQDAAAVFGITGNLITVKATTLSGTSRYTTIIATPPAAWEADTNEVLDLEIEDANGDSSVTIQAASVSTFEIWKVADATAEDDYADGELLDTVGPGKFRFIGENGYKLVIRDQGTNYRVSVEAEKGVYLAELFFGPAVQLAQSALVEQMYTLVQALGVDLSAVQGTGFASSTDSLKALRVKIDAQTTAIGSPVQAGDTINANIVQVNYVDVDGTGVSGDEWGPAGSPP